MTPQPALDPPVQPRKATGPTTPEGKARASQNALRHGLSGQTVVMPWEDREAYQAHCAAILKSLSPAGDIETQLAQGIADDQWRLNRARAVDSNMFALGQLDYSPVTGDAQVDAALNSARAFRDHSKAFANLSIYEQRINRSLEKNFDRLQTLRNERELEEGMARADAIRQKVMREHAARQASGASALAGFPNVPPAAAVGREFVYATAPRTAAHSTPPLSDAHRKAA
jgi:hypothetical protein